MNIINIIGAYGSCAVIYGTLGAIIVGTIVAIWKGIQ